VASNELKETILGDARHRRRGDLPTFGDKHAALPLRGNGKTRLTTAIPGGYRHGRFPRIVATDSALVYPVLCC